MKLKSFFAASVEAALGLAREELGGEEFIASDSWGGSWVISHPSSVAGSVARFGTEWHGMARFGTGFGRARRTG